MTLPDLPYEKIGFWGLLILNVSKEGFLLFKKYFPHLIRKGEREQDREDKQLQFDQQMRLREIEAIEGIKELVSSVKDFMTLTYARLDSIDNKLATRKLSTKK